MLRGRRPLVFLALVLAAASACSRTEARTEPAPTLAAAVVDAASPPPIMVELANEATAAPRAYRIVLHTGDSTVGGGHGLARALRTRFEAEGARYISDTVNSASLLTSETVEHVAESIAKHKPDLVLINLGTNEVFVPAPRALEHRIRAVVEKVGPRDCVWIGPPTWKGDKGIVQVIRENAGRCRFFDSSNMELERISDGIHPTDKGGEKWAETFWTFFRG